MFPFQPSLQRQKKGISVHFTIIPRCTRCDSLLSVRQSKIETNLKLLHHVRNQFCPPVRVGPERPLRPPTQQFCPRRELCKCGRHGGHAR